MSRGPAYHDGVRPITVACHEAAAMIVEYGITVPRPVILVDGGSGSGKTSLAAQVAQAWPHPLPLQTVCLDNVYPGWSGLAAGSRAVPGIIAGPCPGYQRWDWDRARPAEQVQLDPAAAVLVEGCGALSRVSARLATLRVWVEVDAATRRAAPPPRDRGGFDPYWELWAAQEHTHWRRNQPWRWADLLVADPDRMTDLSYGRGFRYPARREKRSAGR